MKWPKNHPGFQRVLSPAARDKSSKTESVVCLLVCHFIQRYDSKEKEKALLQGSHVCHLPQWAVLWEPSTVGSRNSVSSVLLLHTRTQLVSCPVNPVPALKDRASLEPRMCLSVEVSHHPIFSFSSNQYKDQYVTVCSSCCHHYFPFIFQIPQHILFYEYVNCEYINRETKQHFRHNAENASLLASSTLGDSGV